MEIRLETIQQPLRPFINLTQVNSEPEHNERPSPSKIASVATPHRATVTSLIPTIKKFIHLSKKLTESFRFKALTKTSLVLLNDLAEGSQQKELKSKFGRFFSNFLRRYAPNLDYLFQYVTPIHPYNTLKLVWDSVHVLIILTFLFIIPIDVCFSTSIEQPFRSQIVVFLCADLLLNFNLSYFHKGFIVRNRNKIMANYLKTELLPDLLSILFYVSEWGFLKLIFALRWKKIMSISDKIIEKFNLGLMLNHSMIQLINLLVFSFCILNLCACLWFYVAISNPNREKTWLSVNDLLTASSWDQYVYSLYWSTVTIMTVGYGDISAENSREAIFSTITIFFGCGLFAYFINAVGCIVQELEKEGNIYKNKLAVINKYMEKRNINQALQMKIREYLRFIWQEESTQNSETEREIIEKLSKSLKMELIFESYGQILQKYPLFFANFSEKCLSELMYEIKEVRNIPEDLIFADNIRDDSEVYFIVKGKVQLFSSNPLEASDAQIIQELKEGDIFGEIGFLTGGNRSCSAKSSDFTTLFFIKREDFLRTLSRNPEDYERYCMIRDQIVLQSQMSFVQTKCFSCASKEHLVTQCPLIHYVADRIKVVKRYITDPGQKERTRFQRPRQRKFNSLGYLVYVVRSNERFRKFAISNFEDQSQEFYRDVTPTTTVDKFLFDNQTANANTMSNNNNQIGTNGVNFKENGLETEKKSAKKLKINTNFEKMLRSEKNFETFESHKHKVVNFTEQQAPEEGSFVINVPRLSDFGPVSEEERKELTLNPRRTSSLHDFQGLEHINEGSSATLPKEPRLSAMKGSQILKREASRSFINIDPALERSILLKDDEINDEFLKSFEKGGDFKNYFPEFNLSRTIVRSKFERQQKMERIVERLQRSGLKHHSLTKIKAKYLKANKIVPFEPQDFSGNMFKKQEKENLKEERKRDSNIFKRRTTTKFSTYVKPRITFFDVVSEVLFNAELRKKLSNQRQKSRQRKKMKFLKYSSSRLNP